MKRIIDQQSIKKIEQLLDLPKLSIKGCGLPGIAEARGRYIRAKIIKNLYSKFASDREIMQALIFVCQHHVDVVFAAWWMKNEYKAEEVLVQTIAQVQNLKLLAESKTY